MSVKHKLEGKFEFVYLKDVVVYYASVLEPKFKYQSTTEKEFGLTAFITDADRLVLEDDVRLNKSIFKVGVDKNKKRAIKYPNDKYADVEGLNGIQLTLNELRKNGQPNQLVVVDKEGKQQTDLVGNGSRCNIKLFGYRNVDDLLVVSLNLIQVIDLVPYEGGGGSFDEELGIAIPKQTNKPSVTSKFEDDDVPAFGEEDDNPFV